MFRTYEYWSNVHKMLVSEHRPVRIAVRMWMEGVPAVVAGWRRRLDSSYATFSLEG